MPNIIAYQFEQVEVRMAELDGEPLFCLPDLLRAMVSKTRPTDAKVSLEEVFGDGVVIDYLIPDSLGRKQDTMFVREFGATFLISRSRTEIGKRLNRWIHQDILCAIRKTGGYGKTQSVNETVVQPLNFEALFPPNQTWAETRKNSKFVACKFDAILMHQIVSDSDRRVICNRIFKAVLGVEAKEGRELLKRNDTVKSGLHSHALIEIARLQIGIFNQILIGACLQTTITDALLTSKPIGLLDKSGNLCLSPYNQLALF